jgi:parallel beta-helix repeat protein
MAVGLTFLLTTGLAYYLLLPPALPPSPLPIPQPPTPLQLTPHDYIEIDGDVNFSATALLEGWPGDGSSENPYIIDGLDIEVGGVNRISISNTRVSFTISNCDLTGGFNGPRVGGAGIYLENVTNGELVNNIFFTLMDGIVLYGSSSNTVFNNTFTEGLYNIVLDYSDYNTVANNTCTNGVGISLRFSDYNTVANNTCNNNGEGIYLESSDYNTVANNNCSSNGNNGISLESSDYNTVANNICNNNRIGIYLDDESDFNTVENNTFSGNTEHDVLGEYMTEEDGTEEFDPVFLLPIGFAGIIMLGAAWRLLSGIREFNKTIPYGGI